MVLKLQIDLTFYIIPLTQITLLHHQWASNPTFSSSVKPVHSPYRKCPNSFFPNLFIPTSSTPSVPTLSYNQTSTSSTKAAKTCSSSPTVTSPWFLMTRTFTRMPVSLMQCTSPCNRCQGQFIWVCFWNVLKSWAVKSRRKYLLKIAGSIRLLGAMHRRK